MTKKGKSYRVSIPGSDIVLQGTAKKICEDFQAKSPFFGGPFSDWAAAVAKSLGRGFPRSKSDDEKAEWIFGRWLLNGMLAEVEPTEEEKAAARQKRDEAMTRAYTRERDPNKPLPLFLLRGELTPQAFRDEQARRRAAREARKGCKSE